MHATATEPGDLAGRVQARDGLLANSDSLMNNLRMRETDGPRYPGVTLVNPAPPSKTSRQIVTNSDLAARRRPAVAVWTASHLAAWFTGRTCPA